MSTAGSMPEWRIPDGMELKRRRSYANRSSRRSASPRNHTRSTRTPCARSRISRWRGSAPPGVDEPGRRNTSVHSPGDSPGGSAAVLLRCADSGALTPAQCGDFISRLEQGWDTPAGGKLSGGERQRIAIARAILKYAPVVILDEVTAFTDLENEAQLQCSIARLRALHLPLVFPGTEGSRSLIRIAPFDGAQYRNPAVGFHRRIFVRVRAASACEPAAHRIPGHRNPGYPRG